MSEQNKNNLRVFVSYGHDEYVTFAKSIAEELCMQGHEVWFDEKRLKPGGDWELYIEEGLDWVGEDPSRGRILLIMTPYSVRRPDGYCLNEIAKALDNKIKIVPVMLVWTTPPLSIYRLQWVDMTCSQNKKQITGTFASDVQKITSALEIEEVHYNASRNLFNQLHPLNYDTELVLYQTWFVGREWVFEEINQWLTSPAASRLFWITGLPGIGKTAIATRLLQQCPQVVAFHICRRGNSEKTAPRRIICTLAYQLSTQMPEYKSMLEQLDLQTIIDTYNDGALFETLLVQPLNQMSTIDRKSVVLLIDGLDEATHGAMNPLANFIAAEFDRLPNWVRIIITSRPDKEVRVPLQTFAPWYLESQSEGNKKDIQNYILERLANHIDHPEFEKACQEILRKSEGVFLYAKHVCDEIQAGKLKLSSLEAFPNGLGGVYYQYFLTKFQDVNQYNALVEPAMELMAARKEPLTLEEMRTYLQWNKKQLSLFLTAMGTFVVQKDGGELLPFHLSLIDWLCDEEKAGSYWIDIDGGHDTIANYHLNNCITSSYALKYLLQHLVLACKEQFVRVFCDAQYQDLRKSSMGTAVYFDTFLEDIRLFYLNGGAMVELYSNPVFQRIILKNHIYFFDHDYYRNLRDCGFENYIRTIDISTASIETKSILICYYYIIYDIKAVVDIPLPLVDDQELHKASLAELDNYRLIYEIKASSYRISGDFERAKQYIRVAIKSSELLQRMDYLLVLHSVHARIDMHEEKYQEAIAKLCDAIEQGDKIISSLSFESDLSAIQHIRTGSTLILIEQYLNLGQPHNVWPLLEQMKELYDDPKKRDRYWSRYLYLSSLYAIQIQDEVMYEYFQQELQPYSLTQVGGRLFYHPALSAFVKGKSSNDTAKLNYALDYINLYIQKAEERYDLELMAEGFALKCEILTTMKEPLPLIPDSLQPFGSWINLKRNLFSSISNRYFS